MGSVIAEKPVDKKSRTFIFLSAAPGMAARVGRRQGWLTAAVPPAQRTAKRNNPKSGSLTPTGRGVL